MSTVNPSPTRSISSWDELSRYANHHERGWLLLEHAHDLSGDDYWRAVADAWLDSDRQSLAPADWRGLWLADRPGREQVMTVEDRDALAALPERVTVYRGVNCRNYVAGISWTLDRNLAHWFALRWVNAEYPKGFTVISGTVLRHRILALLQDSEHEIIAQPKHVYGRSWDRPDPDRARQITEARQREERERHEAYLRAHADRKGGD
jgi:hypothetical protein